MKRLSSRSSQDCEIRSGTGNCCDFYRELLSGSTYATDYMVGILGWKRLCGPGPMLYEQIWAALGDAPASDFARALLSGSTYAADCMAGSLRVTKAAWGPGVETKFNGQWDADGASSGSWDTFTFTLECNGAAEVLWITDNIPDQLHWLGNASSTGIWKGQSDYWHADGQATGIFDIAVEPLGRQVELRRHIYRTMGSAVRCGRSMSQRDRRCRRSHGRRRRAAQLLFLT